MYAVVFASDRPGMAETRAAARPAHRHYLRNPGAHAVAVRLGGPMLDEAGAMTGTMLVVEADDLAAVRAFVADDPYVRAGLFASIEIRPWDWGLGRPDG